MLNALKTRKGSAPLHKHFNKKYNYRKDKSWTPFGAQGDMESVGLGIRISEFLSLGSGVSSGPFRMPDSRYFLSSRGADCHLMVYDQSTVKGHIRAKQNILRPQVKILTHYLLCMTYATVENRRSLGKTKLDESEMQKVGSQKPCQQAQPVKLHSDLLRA